MNRLEEILSEMIPYLEVSVATPGRHHYPVVCRVLRVDGKTRAFPIPRENISTISDGMSLKEIEKAVIYTAWRDGAIEVSRRIHPPLSGNKNERYRDPFGFHSTVTFYFSTDVFREGRSLIQPDIIDRCADEGFIYWNWRSVAGQNSTLISLARKCDPSIGDDGRRASSPPFSSFDEYDDPYSLEYHRSIPLWSLAGGMQTKA